MAWNIHDLHDAIFGTDARKQVGRKLKEYGCTKAVVIYDPALKDYVGEVMELIEAEGLQAVIYQAANGEPVSSEVEKYVDFCKKEQIDGMVALGGGSTMDTAKIGGKTLANGGKVTDYLGGYTALGAGNKLFKPIICMATTSGTGSEVSYGLMCLNEENNKKTFCLHTATLAIDDLIYPANMDPYITAYTGIDALAHCAESLCNTYAMENWMADMLCREGVKTAFDYLRTAVKEPDNTEARARMSWAAMCGGYAITERKTSIGHSVSNQISDTFHTHHGEGVACGILVQALYNVKKSPEITKVWAPLFGVDCPEDADLETVGREIYKKLLDLLKDIGLKSMKKLGISEDFCDTAAENISKDKKWAIVPNPPDFEEVRRCLHETWDF